MSIENYQFYVGFETFLRFFYWRKWQTRETSEEYDEEADEYYESEWDVRYDVYISFWQDKNFRLMTEAELKV